MQKCVSKRLDDECLRQVPHIAQDTWYVIYEDLIVCFLEFPGVLRNEGKTASYRHDHHCTFTPYMNIDFNLLRLSYEPFIMDMITWIFSIFIWFGFFESIFW